MSDIKDVLMVMVLLSYFQGIGLGIWMYMYGQSHDNKHFPDWWAAKFFDTEELNYDMHVPINNRPVAFVGYRSIAHEGDPWPLSAKGLVVLVSSN